MPRGLVAMALPLPGNPYSRPKEQEPGNTLCELCDRIIATVNWNAHKNSKKHRLAEAKERDTLNNVNGFGGDATGLADGNNGFTTTISGHDAWGSSEFDAGANTSNFGNKSGGGSGACFGCGDVGHNKRDCPKGGSGGVRACYNCGNEGHMSRDCTEPKKPYGGNSGGGDRLCFNCNTPGHNKVDCPEAPRRNGGGGGRACHNCKEEGHISRECPHDRIMRCNNCDAEGHIGRECNKPRDWSRVKCRNCQEFGHGAARCDKPVNENTTGGWGNNDDSGVATGVATGGWAEAPSQESTSNWADDATAAAEGNSWPNASATTAW